MFLDNGLYVFENKLKKKYADNCATGGKIMHAIHLGFNVPFNHVQVVRM